MPDVLKHPRIANYDDVMERWVDVGDGSHAKTVSVRGIAAGSISGLLPVDVLAGVGVARQLTALTGSTNVALTSTCRRISIFARGADMRYLVGTGAQTASGASHWIGQNERLDLDVPASANLAVIRAGGVDGTLEISELTLV